MKRLRIAAFAAVAGLAFVPGCSCFDGQLLNRMGCGPHSSGNCAECSTCGSTTVLGEGPLLGDPAGSCQNGNCGQPAGVQEMAPGYPITPGMQTAPFPRVAPQQAQPVPAGPVSTTKSK